MKKTNFLFRATIFLMLVCILFLSPLMLISANASCVYTVDEAMTWLENQVGTTIEDGECVRLIQAYYTYLGVARPSGNGCDYATNTLPDGWTRIEDGTPKKGDIMVWVDGYKGYGHVAICGGTGVYYHQNWEKVNGVGIVSKESSSHTSGYSLTVDGVSYRANYWGIIRPNYPSTSQAADVPSPVSNSVANGNYMIKSVYNPSYYMNVYAGTDANGTKVVTWTIDKDTDDQHFKFVHQGSGAYYIYGVGLTSRVLDIYYGSNNKVNLGDYLQVWKKGVDPDSSQFNIVPVGDNKFVFELKSMDNAVLGITSAANNKSITLQQYIASNKQHWYICDYNGNILSTCDLGGHKVSDGTCTVCGEVFLSITAQPQSVTVPSGEKATVSVEAKGNSDLTYEWYYSDNGGTTYYKTSTFTSNTYSVSMTSARDGRMLYCVISDASGNSVTTDIVSIHMQKSALSITEQSTSVTVAEGETAKVTVKATGDGLTYRWYYKNAGESSYTYTSSFKGSSYYVTMNEARDGRQVLCRVYDKYGNVVQTNTVKLSMENYVKITQQPASVTVAEGEIAKVTVTATGDGLTYRWYYKNAGDSSYTYTSSFKGSSYYVTMNGARDGRQVLCRIYDKYGNVIQTNTVTLKMS